jgi:predicted Zn-dependent protease
MAAAMRDNAWAVRKIAVEGEVSASRVRRAVVTGRGGPLLSAESDHGAFVMLDGNDWDTASSRAPVSAAVPTLGSELLRSLPTREVTVAEFLGGPGEVDAVIHPRMLEGLLRALLTERVGMDRVLAGISPAKVGDTLAHKGFELIDDTSALSLAGHASDDEGHPGTRKAVIRDGVLATLLADRRSAQRAGVAPTGNGFRIPILAEDRAEAPVRVGMGHLEVRAGEVPRDALTRGKAVLIPDLLGVHSANKSTGAFNNPIVGGLALEDGVPVARLKAGAWSATGVFYEILQSASRISRERFDTGSATLPWLAARVRVA